jgi:hypothetical protein
VSDPEGRPFRKRIRTLIGGAAVRCGGISRGECRPRAKVRRRRSGRATHTHIAGKTHTRLSAPKGRKLPEKTATIEEDEYGAWLRQSARPVTADGARTRWLGPCLPAGCQCQCAASACLLLLLDGHGQPACSRSFAERRRHGSLSVPLSPLHFSRRRRRSALVRRLSAMRADVTEQGTRAYHANHYADTSRPTMAYHHSSRSPSRLSPCSKHR